MTRVLLGREFIKHLVEIGALPQGKYEKIIIEASLKSVVRIYTQTMADDSLLGVKFAEPALVVTTEKKLAEERPLVNMVTPRDFYKREA
jgi:hypothetical protein